MTQRQPERVSLFGDLSGWVDPFVRSLERLGVDTDLGRIPLGRKIVPIGDLIHKGPDSNDVVSLVDHLMKNSPNQIVVLIGNHEAHHLGGPKIAGGGRPGPGQGAPQGHSPVCNCDHQTIETLRTWVRDRKLLLAVAVGENHETLVTHAGLGKPMWTALGSPGTAVEAANLLNQQLRNDPRKAFQAGLMLTSRNPLANSRVPGVVWAHGAAEVYESWRGEDVPFDQVHGHVRLFRPNVSGRDNPWGRGMTPELQALSTAYHRERRSETVIGGRTFTGIDPGFTADQRSLTHEMTPLEVRGLNLGTPSIGTTFSF